MGFSGEFGWDKSLRSIKRVISADEWGWRHRLGDKTRKLDQELGSAQPTLGIATQRPPSIPKRDMCVLDLGILCSDRFCVAAGLKTGWGRPLDAALAVIWQTIEECSALTGCRFIYSMLSCCQSKGGSLFHYPAPWVAIGPCHLMKT